MTCKPVPLKIWFAWLIVTLIYAYQFVLRIVPSVMLKQITTKYNIAAFNLGHFAGLYYMGYAIMHLPFGILYDRLNARIVLCVSIIMIIIGQSPLIYSNSWNMVLVGRFIFGAGSSGAILAVFKIIRSHFPPDIFPRLLSISVTIGLIGALAGGYPTQKLLAHYSWYTVQLSLIGIGLGLMLLNLIFIPDSGVPNVEKIFFKPLRNKSVILPILVTAGVGGLMVGPVEGFADFWGPNFLKTVYRLTPSQSAFLPSLIFIGMAVGTPLMGLWIEKTNRYDVILKVCTSLMAGLFTAILCFKIPYILLYGLFFIIGMMCSYQILIIHINNLRVDSQYTGVVSAISNMIIMILGSIFHYLIGFIMNCTAPSSCNFHPSKNPYYFELSLSVISLGLITAYIVINKKNVLQ